MFLDELAWRSDASVTTHSHSLPSIAPARGAAQSRLSSAEPARIGYRSTSGRRQPPNPDPFSVARGQSVLGLQPVERSPYSDLIPRVAASSGTVQVPPKVACSLVEGKQIAICRQHGVRDDGADVATVFAIGGGIVADSPGISSQCATVAREFHLPPWWARTWPKNDSRRLGHAPNGRCTVIVVARLRQ